MILDINGYIGKWPYWPVSASGPQEVVAALNSWGIDRAAVCSTRGIFVSSKDGNRETTRAAETHRELIGFACFGPLEFSGTLPGQDFFDAYQAMGFRGVRLYPQHHSYHPLYSAFVDRICEEAAAREWPVMLPLRLLMNWGVPMLSVDWIVALVERHPRTPWILAGINYLHELQAAEMLLRRHPSVNLETSCIQGFQSIARLVSEYGSERLLFGSGAPLQHGGAGLAKILHARIPERDREMILGLNAQRLLGIS